MSDKKEFSLKQSEIVLLSNIQQQANILFSQAVSYVLVDRLAYNVTEQTRFTIQDDKLTVWEEPEPVAETKGGDIADAAKETK